MGRANKVYIVTGGNSGIGYETSLALAKTGARVIIASRNKAKVEAAIEQIYKEAPAANVEYLSLNLASITGAIESAQSLLAKLERIDGLIANAGISGVPFKTTADGFEIQFAVNHLGHFAFTNTLLPLIEKTATTYGEARIVVVSSSAAKKASQSEIKYEYLTKLEGGKDPRNFKGLAAAYARYERSKYANVLYAYELNRRLQQRGIHNVYVNSLHPGIIGATGLADSDAKEYIPAWVMSLILFMVRNFFSITPARGAATSLYLATSKDVPTRNINGQFWSYSAKGPIDANEAKCGFKVDPAAASRLWQYSDEVIKRQAK